ncbi:hypothetical protein AWZ03_014580 [Drosophila navojoa]|uniref:Uncharacterized protein n=1 Tax=Drosophila navojoa TaxID=7232 RepID=A0A484ARL3_DRONA|nr:hypothetical protein AWZ03_014580 [Drosophila navojoa]
MEMPKLCQHSAEQRHRIPLACHTIYKSFLVSGSVSFQEFAQHTMNELLGWYGFDGVDVDRLDLTAKTSRLLQSAAAAAVATQQQQQQQQQLQQQQQQQRSHLRSSRSSALATAFHNNNNNNNSCSNRKASNSNCHSNTTTPSDHDTRSSREDDSKSPHSIGKPSATVLTTSHTDDKIGECGCPTTVYHFKND